MLTYKIFDTQQKYKSKGRPLLCHVSIVIVNKHIATAYHMHELAMGEFQETVFVFLFLCLLLLEHIVESL